MGTYVTLVGEILVADSAIEDFDALQKTFDDAGCEDIPVDLLDRGVGFKLRIGIHDEELRYGFGETVLPALAAFCHKHATAGAVFNYGDGDTLVFGPTPEAKKLAHVAYLTEAVIEAEALLEQATCHDLSYYDKDIV